ncbi:hypothetical protein HYALB_00006570 [Hymenoscyphus albidus]|uniref:DUF3074 domain-containing protein n=1 Tax=Hymenoscyphus albidus TaxID=595503 RepID=A0A9N9M0B7_9HELO|nr:hypothetical protein HYALB_00006570 [Hymenoscyphus albidus]
MTYKLGPWVRLEGISFKQLPPGAKGITNSTSPAQGSEDRSGSVQAPSVESFIQSVLSESIGFIDGVAPKSGSATTWKMKGTPKTFSSSAAPVQLYEWTVPGKQLDQVEGMSQFSADRSSEFWCCRRSVHRNISENGTASWEEFRHNFKDNHAESEKAFTPTVIEARQAMKWDTTGMTVEASGEKWENILVAVEEMKHRIEPKPLNNRTFPVIQITADLVGAQEFIVVSIPLNDFEKSPYSEFAKDKSLVIAAYTSIERIRILPANSDIEWIMATASNAKGVLPQWMQNLAVPGAIAKDVDFFMSWIPSQRRTVGESNGSGQNTPNPKKGDKPFVKRADSKNKALPETPVQ